MFKVSQIIYWIITSVILVAFFVGAYVLENMGIQYVSEGGSALFKIHIYSYISLSLFAFFLVKCGLASIAKSLGVWLKPWALLVAAVIYLIAYGLVTQGMSGMAYIIDSLLTPLLLFPLILSISNERKDKLIKLIFGLMLINAATAVFEYARGINLWKAEYVSYFYFRANGWLAHPLSNALIMSSLTPLLFRVTQPLLFFFVMLTALLAFGGRTAAGIFFVFSGFLLLYRAVEGFRSKGGFSVFSVVTFFSAAFLGSIALLYAIVELDMGNRIFENATIDGSAQTRLDVFNVLYYLKPSEFAFGAQADIFAELFYFAEVNVIENYILGWFLAYGYVGAGPLILCFFWFFYNLYKEADIYGKVSVLTFILISVTNNALSIKTVSLLFFLVAFAAYHRSEGVK